MDLPVSTLCDVDKAPPVLDPAIRPLTRARMTGPAVHAVLGELLANEAARRGLGGIVVDGYVRDRSGLPDWPMWARGTTSRRASGSRSRSAA